MIVPVILSGGSGSRLWPLSREIYPKQFLPLVNEQTMLQNTITRLAGLDDLVAPIVVCNETHRFMVAEQLRLVDHRASAIMLEPVGRNTAPAVALAALQAMEDGHDPVLLVLPADHVIGDPDLLCQTIQKAKDLAAGGGLITFGIVPGGPETGYGYIKAGKKFMSEAQFPSGSACRIERFVEKPDLTKAREYIESGDYFWNSGMFMFLASKFLQELERFAPEIIEKCRESLHRADKDLDFVRLDADIFASCPSDSIDYAVMEKTDNGVVIPLDAGWSDVGSWNALWEIGQKDERGNVKTGDVQLSDVSDSYLFAQNRLIAAVGVKDLVIIETDDAVLVAHRDQVQEVKTIVDALKKQGRREAVNHRKVYRPWGNYDSIDSSERFQVKRITVKPGAILSAQMHYHRAEHWIVVKGTAKITKGDEVFVLGENQSTYISQGVVHRLENPGKIELELIEVQSGSYLGEDDIVRFDDIYGRVSQK